MEEGKKIKHVRVVGEGENSKKMKMKMKERICI